MSEVIEKVKNKIDALRHQQLSIEELGAQAIELAKLMLDEAIAIESQEEKTIQAQLARMMQDPQGKLFTTAMTDQCFRSSRPKRVMDQLSYLIACFGIPKFLSWDKRLGLYVLKTYGPWFPRQAAAFMQNMVRKQTEKVIVPGEKDELEKHIERRRRENVRVNLNHLGEAILGEAEALKRLEIYLEDLKNPHIEYISVKISTIYSQLSLLGYEDSIDILSQRLKKLYRAAQSHTYRHPDGKVAPKFVNLDMEEYKDLYLTVESFCHVLSEPEFLHHTAGIVLQSYIPDSFLVQKQLTTWAMERVAQGGAPIKIRIVKGANLAMEKVEAALRLWPQAPYTAKIDADANLKKMLLFGAKPEHAKAVHIGLGSHNLFDIAFGLIIRAQNGVEEAFSFEMLEGMADHIRRVVQQIAGSILLYCPTAVKEEFQNAVAYLVRRLDENSAKENFLRSLFNLKAGSKAWDEQAQAFLASCRAIESVSSAPRRTQNRNEEPKIKPIDIRIPFANEPDTDWSLKHNVTWAKDILKRWYHKSIADIPLVIAGSEIYTKEKKSGIDPSFPSKERYFYSLAGHAEIDQALNCAQKAQKEWHNTLPSERGDLLVKVANSLRQNRSELIGAMVLDGGKTIQEADVEISEAIDFAEYYSQSLLQWHSLQGITWQAKGAVLVVPPWNFPCSIPAGGILAALVTGNSVIFKPATEAVLVGYLVAKAFWEAGISKEVLQFIACEDDPVGSELIKDKRLSAIILTGATATAKLFLKMRPGIDLMAETGGKNSIIVTALADRDLAIKDIIASAFGHAGQKCSACSLAILEAEIYDDPKFLQQLCDAAKSLHVGSPWDRKNKVTPLISSPGKALQRALTTLDPGEEWLLKPKQDAINPNLWSPGIKAFVQKGSFTHTTELFGPVLAVMRAKDLKEAIDIANSTPYGLTSGLQTLDDREKSVWQAEIIAGNCYINRSITGAIVQRQPFGGYKESSFGRGLKAGGPNYLMQLMIPKQTALPLEQKELNTNVLAFEERLKRTVLLTKEELELWLCAAKSYAYWWSTYFSKDSDPSHVLGQGNILRYKPLPLARYRAIEQDLLVTICMLIAAALTVKCPLEISSPFDLPKELKLPGSISFIKENDEQLIHRLCQDKSYVNVRLSQRPSVAFKALLAQKALPSTTQPIFAHGRIELLNFLREVSISSDYHRYGNVGESEGL